MKINTRWWILATLVVAALAVVGCSQKKTASETTPPAEKAAPNGEMAEHEMAENDEAPTTPAGSVPEIWTQITEEQGELSAAIENGQLKDVHHLAFGVRDLVVALADKASAANPASAPQLKGLVEQVTASASKLDELGDAGNLSGTQAEYANLVNILGALKTATAGQ